MQLTVTKELMMAVQVLTDLAAAVARDTDVKSSAVTALNAFPALVQTAIAAALTNGATAAELAPVQDAVNTMNASTDALAAAIVASTPAALVV